MVAHRRLLVWVFACGLVGCVADPDSGESAQPLVAAPPDSSHSYAVGLCYSPSGDCSSIDTGGCSGSLVAPNVVLTSRQCVDRAMKRAPAYCDSLPTTMIDAHQFFVTAHEDPYSPGAHPIWYGVQSVIGPERATLCDADIALLFLDRKIQSSEALPVALDLAGEYMPAEVAIAGRGAVAAQVVLQQGNQIEQVTDRGGWRRRALDHIPVLCQAGQASCTVLDDSEPGGTFTPHPNQLVVGPSALPGDSGSGIIEQMSFSTKPVLVGVTSGGTWYKGQPNAALGIAVSKHAEFLENRLQLIAALDEPSGCSTTRGGLLLPLAALAWAMRRRRRAQR